MSTARRVGGYADYYVLITQYMRSAVCMTSVVIIIMLQITRRPRRFALTIVAEKSYVMKMAKRNDPDNGDNRLFSDWCDELKSADWLLGDG